MKNMLIAVGILIIFLIVGYSGCIDKEQIVVGTGTIQYNEFEGGFYGIVGDDGENYDPINLPSDFNEEGLRVKYTLKILKNQTSIHIWGIIVEIIKIEKVAY
jgi:inhibitor of cysteine peptidase